MYRQLDASKIIKTTDQLQRRINERFPDSGLSAVAKEVCTLARAGKERAALIARPYWALRAFSGLLGVLTFAILIVIINDLGLQSFKQLLDFILFFESAIGSLVFIGAALFFVRNFEDRLKRGRALKAVHELRALAHVVDMHQLTKDRERAQDESTDTKSSPKRRLTLFQLSRYLDYCCELLSMISKVGALYAQEYHDPIALNAVDQLDAMTTGLSQKIWQKMMTLGLKNQME